MTIGKVKFSQLPVQVESDLNPNTIFAVVNLGISKKATLTNVKNYLVTDGLATRTYVDNAINSLVDGAPDLLNTLNELADALNNDQNFANTITNLVNTQITTLFPSKTTDDLTEGVNNLYFTLGRSRDAITVVDPTSTLTYDPATGVMTFDAYAGGVVTSINGQTGDVVLSTDDIEEGTQNLYYTTTRVRTSISAGTGVFYNNSTGVISIGQPVSTTDSVTFRQINITENLNLVGNLNITGNVTSDLIIADTTQSLSKDSGALVVEGGVGIEKNLNVGGDVRIAGDLYIAGDIASDININGTLTHQGLVPTEGTNIDQIKTITRNLRLLTDWQDVGINSSDLATGTYIVQLYANDVGAGGTNNNEYYSGIMSWYANNTNSSQPQPTDEVPLHRAGGSGDGNLYLRTFRTASADPANLKLQIYSNIEAASAANYVFKFRRVI